jgi:hypothetical protein
VPIVILLVLVAVLWIVVLTPSVLRRVAERQGVGSIDHFHHQLQLLEHAGPKLVAPAYRLQTALPGGGGGVSFDSAEPVSHRPKLVLLRPVDDEQSADIDGDDGAHYERVRVLDVPEPSISPAETRAGLAAYRRQQARHRCTILLRMLTTATVSTGLIGMLPSAHLAWICTGVFGIASMGLIGLIAYAREVEAHQPRRRPGYDFDLQPEEPYLGAAESGYPGAWDDEYEELAGQFAAVR